VNHRLLLKPSLYLSDFFEKHRASYYDALSIVRASNDLVHWIKFFLNGVYSTAQNGVATFQKILKLKNKIETQVVTLNRRAGRARTLMEILYRFPVLNVKQVAVFLAVTQKSAYELIHELEKLNILVEMTGKRRNKNYIFQEYLDAFNI
jgi:Fic family protein